jgi:hypothetical protein
MWRDCEGPDEKVSRHLGRLVTEGRTLIMLTSNDSLDLTEETP